MLFVNEIRDKVLLLRVAADVVVVVAVAAIVAVVVVVVAIVAVVVVVVVVAVVAAAVVAVATVVAIVVVVAFAAVCCIFVLFLRKSVEKFQQIWRNFRASGNLSKNCLTCQTLNISRDSIYFSYLKAVW